MNPCIDVLRKLVINTILKGGYKLHWAYPRRIRNSSQSDCLKMPCQFSKKKKNLTLWWRFLLLLQRLSRVSIQLLSRFKFSSMIFISRFCSKIIWPPQYIQVNSAQSLNWNLKTRCVHAVVFLEHLRSKTVIKLVANRGCSSFIDSSVCNHGDNYFRYVSMSMSASFCFRFISS